MGPEGDQLGIMDKATAIAKAQGMKFDLVEIAPKAKPPVCKIMNYGKFKYEIHKRERKIKAQERTRGIKEIKMGIKIKPHDYDTKLKHLRRFLEEKGKAKVTVMFRGRERVHKDLGHKILQRLTEDLADVASLEAPPRDEGPNLSALFGSKPPERPEKGQSPNA